MCVAGGRLELFCSGSPSVSVGRPASVLFWGRSSRSARCHRLLRPGSPFSPFIHCGLGLPFLASASLADGLPRWRRMMGPPERFLQIGAGMVLIVIGVAMITGYMSVFSFWLLENIPILARIG